MSTQVLGEQSLHLTTPNIKVVAMQTSSVSNALFSLGDVKFHMPANLEKQLNIASSGKKEKCYGTMMTVYNTNPFFSEMVRIETLLWFFFQLKSYCPCVLENLQDSDSG